MWIDSIVSHCESGGSLHIDLMGVSQVWCPQSVNQHLATKYKVLAYKTNHIIFQTDWITQTHDTRALEDLQIHNEYIKYI
jgi:hypothetical protein